MDLAFNMQLKIARIEKELSMDEVTKLTGVAKSTISEMESGKKSPTVTTINKVIEAYGYELRIVKKETA